MDIHALQGAGAPNMMSKAKKKTKTGYSAE